VFLCLHAFNGHDDDVCDKIGRAIGNLQSLKKLWITTRHYHREDDGEDEDSPIPDREILARVLRHVRQSVTVITGNDDDDDERQRTTEEVKAFARAIRGHPTITSFEDFGRFPYASLDIFYSALATLPSLESITLGTPELRQADESTLANPESLTELLRAPSLRSVCFVLYFTPALCQATANAFMEGTTVTKLEFSECAFSTGGSSAIMAIGLSRNTSAISIIVKCWNDRALFDALAAALPSNSTLQHLELGRLDNDDNDDNDCLPAVFSALGQNTGLKSLKVAVYELMDESLSTAMKDGLGMNATLESLELNCVRLTEDKSYLWCRALSFLRTNKAP
jgi:hypothetical protein